MIRLNSTMLIANGQRPTPNISPFCVSFRLKCAAPLVDDLRPDDEAEGGRDQGDEAGPEEEELLLAGLRRGRHVVVVDAHAVGSLDRSGRGDGRAGPRPSPAARTPRSGNGLHGSRGVHCSYPSGRAQSIDRAAIRGAAGAAWNDRAMTTGPSVGGTFCDGRSSTRRLTPGRRLRLGLADDDRRPDGRDADGLHRRPGPAASRGPGVPRRLLDLVPPPGARGPRR